VALEITKTFVVSAPPAAVWSFLVDVRRVAKCMPGAAITAELDDKTYTGTMTIKVGPVTSSYKGKVVFEKLDPAAHTAEIVATGQDVKGKGGADMRMKSSLKELAPGQTEVTAVSAVNITGILAQMGRGMIQDVSDQLFQVFSKNMRAELESAQPTPAPSPPPAAEVMETATDTATATDTDTAPVTATVPVTALPAAPLDLGAIGAKAAGRAALRTFTRPVFWLVVVAIAVVIYFVSR
jgi:hypothetical protein